jgi:phage terminase large subunit-like protein
MQYLAAASERLAARPDRLSAGLETYFRYQALEAMIESLAEGLRRYESPQKGDALVSAMAESASYRDRLRQYLVDLAASKEQEFAVADREAQRCRGILAADPPAGAGRKQGRK